MKTASVLPLWIGLSATLLFSCGESETKAPPVGTPPPKPVVWQPTGCNFKVSSRIDYLKYEVGKTQSVAAPNIRRVRLGLGGHVSPGMPGRADPSTSAAFAWQTDDGTLASEVQWGTVADPSMWPAGNRVNGATWLTPAGIINPNGDARMHEAYLCGLAPATTYYYRVGGGEPGNEAWSDVYSFTTTPNDPNTTIKVGLTGDSRGQDNQAYRLIQKRFASAGLAVQLFSGDMINLAPDQKEWEEWLDLAWKDENGALLTLGSLLNLQTHGNHENYTTLFFGNLVLPQDPDTYPESAELFYSVDIGPMHLVVVDDLSAAYPTGNEAKLAELTKWLKADLDAANKNRGVVPWIVTMHHHSDFSSSSHGEDADVLRVRSLFVPIWDEFKVDLNVAGHDHNYERTKAITGPADNPVVQTMPGQGTVYVVCAGAGADAYGNGTSAFTETSRTYDTAMGSLGFYSIMEISKTSLKFDAYELRADATDPVIDTFTLTK